MQCSTTRLRLPNCSTHDAAPRAKMNQERGSDPAHKLSMAPDKCSGTRSGSAAASETHDQRQVDWEKLIKPFIVVRHGSALGTEDALTAARLKAWQQHRYNPLVCSVHLIADKNTDPQGTVPVSALVLLEHSGYFRALLRHQQDMAPDSVTAVALPQPLPLQLLEVLAQAMHGGELELTPDTVEPLLRAMSAMEMMPLCQDVVSAVTDRVIDDDWSGLAAMARLIVELGLLPALDEFILSDILQHCLRCPDDHLSVPAAVFTLCDQKLVDTVVCTFWDDPASQTEHYCNVSSTCGRSHTPLLVFAARQPELLQWVRWERVPPAESRAVFDALPHDSDLRKAPPPAWSACMERSGALGRGVRHYHMVDLSITQLTSSASDEVLVRFNKPRGSLRLHNGKLILTLGHKDDDDEGSLVLYCVEAALAGCTAKLHLECVDHKTVVDIHRLLPEWRAKGLDKLHLGVLLTSDCGYY